MLTTIRIQNLALVDDLTWEPAQGFISITGETGAGKSILIGALNLLLGERADKSLIRTGSEQCTVEGIFQLPPQSPIHALLEEQGLDACEEGQLILRRIVSANSAGRQFVNGSPSPLTLLKSIGDFLVDLHGPHDHQSLFSREAQTRVLDAYAQAHEARTAYRTLRSQYLALVREEEDFSRDNATIEREIDLLRHQTEEIESANPDPAEEEQLVARHKASTHGARLQELAAGLAARLEDADPSLRTQLEDAGRVLREMSKLDPSTESMTATLETASQAISELADAARDYAADIEMDPDEIQRVEERLDLLQNLKRKYGPTLEAVVQFGTQAAEKLASQQDRENRRSNLGPEITRLEKETTAAGNALGKLRRSACQKLAKQVVLHLQDLGFLKAEFSISLDRVDGFGPDGLEQAEFIFCPNPGEPPMPLRSIASSGEISRVMLALKSALAAQDDIPVLVFDEIDANVGGEVAAKVGAKMAELGRSRQVLCITHLPPVAAAADSHFLVRKSVKSGRTTTEIAALTGTSRHEEIARMLGGVTKSALQHAKALLKS